MDPANLLFIGAKNSVSALDRTNGNFVWTTHLKRSGLSVEFVTLHVDGGQVFAHAGGELFCLEISTGRILWTNPLRGLGYGIATITTQDAKMNPAAAQAQRSADLHDSTATYTSAITAT
jgi:outer membrane protein assembly factor BamB